MSRSYIVDDPVKQQFLLDREALVSASVLADEMRACPERKPIAASSTSRNSA